MKVFLPLVSYLFPCLWRVDFWKKTILTAVKPYIFPALCELHLPCRSRPIVDETSRLWGNRIWTFDVELWPLYLMAFGAVFLQMPAEYIYHSPMKLREGNVFRRVFPSVILSTGGSGTGPRPPLYRAFAPALPLPLRHTQTCSTWTSLYTSLPLPLPLPLDMFKLLQKHRLSESGRLAYDWNGFFFYCGYSTTTLFGVTLYEVISHICTFFRCKFFLDLWKMLVV